MRATFEPGERVRWAGKDGFSRTGVVVEERRPTKIGRVWVQVKVEPCRASSYAGHKLLRLQALERVG